MENRREGRTLPYYGLLNGEIICEATAFIKPDPDEDAEGLIDETTAYLCAFRTNPPYRGQGYFSKLFAYMIEDLRTRGYERVTVGVEPEEVVNKQIYAHYGFAEFVKTDTETYPDGTVINVEYYAKKLSQNTVHYWPVYRCYRGALSSRRRENEQYSYTAEKIESAVLTVVRSYFASFARDAEAVWKEQVRRQLRNKHDDRIRELQAKVEKLQKQQTKLRQEVVNSLSGDSSFDTPLLKSLLDENVVSLKEAEAQLAECQKEKDTEESRLKNMYEQFSRIAAWSEEFDTADVETKKMILARIIEKITIEKGYKIHISFYLTREEIMKELHSGEVEISEADTWYLTGT